MPAIDVIPNVFTGRMYTVTLHILNVRHRGVEELIGVEHPLAPYFTTDLSIRYQPGASLAEALSLDAYLESFSEARLTHEEMVLRIVHDFQEYVKPTWVEITGLSRFVVGRMDIFVKAYGKQPDEIHKGDPK